MDKPLILEINDFLNDLAEVINKYSGKIPCSVMLDKINDITEGYEIFNQPFEEFESSNVDLCVIDAFPGMDIEEIKQKAEKMADNVVII